MGWVTGAFTIGRGVVFGKCIGAGVGKAVTGKALSSVGGKALIGKLSAPFVTKAIAAGMSVSGSSLIGAIAGPLGWVVGGAVGLLVDLCVNEGVELTNREGHIYQRYWLGDRIV